MHFVLFYRTPFHIPLVDADLCVNWIFLLFYVGKFENFCLFIRHSNCFSQQTTCWVVSSPLFGVFIDFACSLYYLTHESVYSLHFALFFIVSFFLRVPKFLSFNQCLFSGKALQTMTAGRRTSASRGKLGIAGTGRVHRRVYPSNQMSTFCISRLCKGKR